MLGYVSRYICIAVVQWDSHLCVDVGLRQLHSWQLKLNWILQRHKFIRVRRVADEALWINESCPGWNPSSISGWTFQEKQHP